MAGGALNCGFECAGDLNVEVFVYISSCILFYLFDISIYVSKILY